MNTKSRASTLPPRRKGNPVAIASARNEQLLSQFLRSLSADLLPLLPAFTATVQGKTLRQIEKDSGIPWDSLARALTAFPKLRPVWNDARSLGEEYRRILREEEAHARAVDGIEEPVYYQGIHCGTITRFSDRLLEFLLKADNPAKYARADVQVNLQTNLLMEELRGTDVASCIGKTIDL